MIKRYKYFELSIFLLLGLFLAFIDIFLKYIFKGVSLFENSLIYFQYVKNYGSAFNMFSGVDNYQLVLAFLALFAIIILIYYYKFFFKSGYMKMAYIFALAGILGNTYDRFVFGYVRDFIGLKYLFVFNIADFYLTLAVLLFVYHELFLEGKKNDENNTY